MSKQRKRYTEEFKREAVELWQSSEKSATEIEEDLGITNGLLYQWKKAFKKQATAEADGSAAEMAKVKRLRRELELVKQERDILKTYNEVTEVTYNEVNLNIRILLFS